MQSGDGFPVSVLLDRHGATVNLSCALAVKETENIEVKEPVVVNGVVAEIA